MSSQQQFEFKVRLPDGRELIESWEGRTAEEAAERLLACKYPEGSIIAWRHPTHCISTALLRGC